MKSFQFRLQTLLDLRCRERDARRADLAELLQKKTHLLTHGNMLADRRAGARLRARQAARDHLELRELIGWRAQERRLAMELEANLRQLGEMERQIERRRLVLVEADRRVKLLERLREKQAAEHAAEVQRREMRDLDEAGSRRAAA